MPPPLDVVLDARRVGNEGRFARSGCWPNAVVRPVICVPSASSSSSNSNGNSNLTINGNGDDMDQDRASLSPQDSHRASPAIDRKGKGRVPPAPTSTRELTLDTTVDSDGPTLTDSGELEVAFGIFALRELKEKEEIVLGWEWDDGSSIHEFPGVLLAEAETGSEVVSDSITVGVASGGGNEKARCRYR
jgi:hypothetical protein